MKIRSCLQRDIATICDIYNYYIVNTTVTFEESPVDAAEMSRRVATYTELYPWYVCEVDGHIVGYAYATKWKERPAYRHSAEMSVYVDRRYTRKGYGRALYSELMNFLVSNTGCHAILGGIALPNDPSTRLHEHFGFKKVAHFPEIGFKFNRWIDVGYWQKTLIPDADSA